MLTINHQVICIHIGTYVFDFRENAERKVWTRLDYFKSLKKKRSQKLPPLKVGVLGCMAERLKKKILETDKMVDIVAGPDAYRDLPRLLSIAHEGQTGGIAILTVIYVLLYILILAGLHLRGARGAFAPP